MRSFFAVAIALLLLGSSVLADVPAIECHVLKTTDLKALLRKDGKLSDLSAKDIEKVALGEGLIQGSCKLSFKTKGFSISIEISTGPAGPVAPKRVDDTYHYSISYSTTNDKDAKVTSSGDVKITDSYTASPKWDETEHVVLFKKVNLKK